jgi:hypothetical protein
LEDPEERERILRTYGGIFKHSIPEFAQKIIKNQRKQENYAR